MSLRWSNDDHDDDRPTLLGHDDRIPRLLVDGLAYLVLALALIAAGIYLLQ